MSILNYVGSLKLNANQKTKVLAAMIGTFRTFLLSYTAAKNKALYSTNPEFVELLEKRNIKAWNTLANEFNSPKKLNVPENKDNYIWKFPLIGTAIIIDAAKSNIKPNELLLYSKKAAISSKMSSIQKKLLDSYIKANSPESIISEMNDLWFDIISKKSNKRKGFLELLKTDLLYSLVPTSIAGYANEEKLIDTGINIPTWAVSSSISLLFLLKKTHSDYNKEINHLNAISNLSSYDNNVEFLLKTSLDKIWSFK